MSEKSKVYVITASERRQKVGLSKVPYGRLSQLQLHSSDSLRLSFESEFLENGPLVEKIAHKLLKHKRVRSEWFNCTIEEAIWAVEKAIAHYKEKTFETVLQPKRYEYMRFTLTLQEDENELLTAFKQYLERERKERVSAADAIREALKRCVEQYCGSK